PRASGFTVVAFSRWRLRGSTVAYARRRTAYRAASTFLVVVRDARTGRTIRAVDAAPKQGGQAADVPGGGVRDIVVAPDGRVAWIVTNPYALGATQVWKADGYGTTLLDQADGIAPASLDLAGDIVRWVRDGVAQQAALAPA
ncbi:MAG TPA: hypothetical protein VNT55_00290, partial [Baekduia sp.]|nr:hypothetical protein [Baekduia sp.]